MATPSISNRSPTLKTVWSGSDDGVAMVSPRKRSFGCSRIAELANSPLVSAPWKDASVSGLVGMTPPLAAITMKFSRPPRPAIATPAMCRLQNANAPSST